MKDLVLQYSYDEAVVHSILYTKPNWSICFKTTSSKMIGSIYFIPSSKFKDLSMVIIATFAKDGGAFQDIDSLVTIHGQKLNECHSLDRTKLEWSKGTSRLKGISIAILMYHTKGSSGYSIMIPVKSDRIHKMLARKVIMKSYNFDTLNTYGSFVSCWVTLLSLVRNCLQKSTIKFIIQLALPIVWSVTQLGYHTMVQLLTDPGTKQQPL